MDDLLIKGVGDNEFKEGESYYHVRMGKGFIDALEAGVQLKDPIENESRLEHGTQMLVSTKMAKRTVTLKFHIRGSSKSDYMSNKNTFENMLRKGMVDIIINDNDHYVKNGGKFTDGVYHLVYTGKSVSYNHSYNGVSGVFMAQFVEPNPYNRTEEPNAGVRVI